MQNVLVDDRRIWVDFSQSVARMNTHWSNDVKRGPGGGGKQGRPGFAGRDDLEQTQRYRREGDSRGSGDKYGMVFDVPDSGRRRKRSRSRDGERERARDTRPRSRSPRRRESERERRRSRSRDRDRRR